MELNLIIAVLAAWRITSALNREKIGRAFRKWTAGENADPVIPHQYTYKDTFLANMVTCFMCLSFWVAVFCTIMLFVFPYFLYPFAISTLAIFLEKVY